MEHLSSSVTSAPETWRDVAGVLVVTSLEGVLGRLTVVSMLLSSGLWGASVIVVISNKLVRGTLLMWDGRSVPAFLSFKLWDNSIKEAAAFWFLCANAGTSWIASVEVAAYLILPLSVELDVWVSMLWGTV